MPINIEPVRGVMVGSYGQAITLTVVDDEGTVQDVSGYTTITIITRSPHDLKTLTSTGSYATGSLGTDGAITYTYASGDIDRSGKWKVQVEFATGTEVFKTRYTTMDVGEALR
jgi:hypothetical protein